MHMSIKGEILTLLVITAIFSTVAPVTLWAETVEITNEARSSSNTGGQSSANGQDGQDGQDGADGKAGRSGSAGADGQDGKSSQNVTSDNSSASSYIETTIDGEIVEQQYETSSDTASATANIQSSIKVGDDAVATGSSDVVEAAPDTAARVGLIGALESLRNKILEYVALLF